MRPFTTLNYMDALQTDLFYSRAQRQLGSWLILLLGLFSIRVIMQLQVATSPIAYLPEFADWHSASVPYPLLYSSQALILAVGWVYVWRLFNTKVVPNPKIGIVLYTLGWLYWLAMFMRLILGFTLMRDVHWFAQELPALFHLLLANMLMLVGHYHRQIRNC